MGYNTKRKEWLCFHKCINNTSYLRVIETWLHKFFLLRDRIVWKEKGEVLILQSRGPMVMVIAAFLDWRDPD